MGVHRQSRQNKDASSSRNSSTAWRRCVLSTSAGRPHHPAANCLQQRLHRTLKVVIMCHADEQWTAALPVVLFGIRTAYKEYLQSSAAKLVYGERPCGFPVSSYYQPPQRSSHSPSYSNSAAIWSSCHQPQQHAMHPRPHSSTSISGTRPTCSCGRTPHAASWRHQTAARTE